MRVAKSPAGSRRGAFCYVPLGRLVEVACGTLLGITGHKDFAGITGLSKTSGLAEGWLAGCEVTTRCTEVTARGAEIATGLEVTTGRTCITARRIATGGSLAGKAVVETALALVAEAFTGSATEVTGVFTETTVATAFRASTESAHGAVTFTGSAIALSTPEAAFSWTTELAFARLEVTTAATATEAGA
jgi:hypothetical protein